MDDPTSPKRDGLAKLRYLAGRLVDEIMRVQETHSGKLSIDENARMARTLTLLAPLIDGLPATPDSSAPRPKTGDELREEDDAIRAEIERRLAGFLRGRELAGSAGDHPEGALPPHDSGLAKLDPSPPTRT
jgi:hypothetical protein